MAKKESTPTMEQTKEQFIRHIATLASTYDDMRMKDFIGKSDREKGYIEGWIAASQAILEAIPLPLLGLDYVEDTVF